MAMIPQDSAITTDSGQIRRTLMALGHGVREVRLLDTRRPRFFGPQVMYLQLPDDMDIGVKHIAAVTGHQAGGVYITGNPLNPALLGRGRGNFFPARSAAADPDVIERRLLYIDIDPVRPSGVNANAEEIRAALERTDALVDWLRAHLNFPEPLFHGTSGSGGMLLYRVEMPNDAQSRDEVHKLLVTLSDELSDAAVKIDASVSNAARCFRIPGTINAKSNTPQPDRPWTLVTGTWCDEDAEVTRG